MSIPRADAALPRRRVDVAPVCKTTRPRLRARPRHSRDDICAIRTRAYQQSRIRCHAGDASSVAFLRRHLLGASTLSDDDVVTAAATFVPQRLEKGAHLLTPGDVCRFSAVVTSGCLRVYASNPDGAEGILYFAPEGWWVGDPNSLLHEGPSRLGIDAVLNTDVPVLDRTRRHPSDAGPCERLLRRSLRRVPSCTTACRSHSRRRSDDTEARPTASG